MALGPKSRKLWLAFLLLMLAINVPQSAFGQLITYVNQVETPQHKYSIIMAIHIDNFSGDTINGFTLWLSVSHPDLVGFFSDSVLKVDTFTTCIRDSCIMYAGDSCLLKTCVESRIDSIVTHWVQRVAVDTTGSLIKHWQYVNAVLVGSNVKINAIADEPGPPKVYGIPSPTSNGLLCKILLETKGKIDSLYCDSVIGVNFDKKVSGYSNEHTQLIGWTWSDTAWRCVKVPPAFTEDSCVRKCAYDSCKDSSCALMYEGTCYLYKCNDCDLWDSAGYVDPQQVMWEDGSITVRCIACDWKVGDANSDHLVNVSDAVWIINYVFVGGQHPLPVTQAGDANCDHSTNVSDAVWIINYVFAGGQAPPCTCDHLLE